MKHLNSSAALLALSHRYQQAEDAGFQDVFLIVVCAAGGLATAGVALLAFVPTHAVLLLAYVLVLGTTLAVLLTVLVMVNGEESESARSKPVAPPHGFRAPFGRRESATQARAAQLSRPSPRTSAE